MITYNMHRYPPEHVLSGPYLVHDFNPELIHKVIDGLTPKNCIVMVYSKKFAGQTDKKERFYGVDYSVSDVTEELISVR